MHDVTRWLTPSEKSRILDEWDVTLARLPALGQGGRGFPDPDIIPWCRRINAIDGVVTLQSCQGHPEGDGESGPGKLWLKLSEELSERFRDRAFELASTDFVDGVELIFQPWGEEVTSITFAGNERDLLDQSLAVVLGFLRSLGSRASEDHA